MIILLKCKCVSEVVEVYVRNRYSDEDVLDWMKVVTSAVSLTHTLNSPHCKENVMEYIEIPVPDKEKGIGYE